MNSSAERRKRVLLADDTQFFRTAFREALEQAACEVVEAEDGQEALDAVQGAGIKGFDLLVLDQVMPKLQGTDVVKKLHEAGRQDRIVLLTGVRAQKVELASLPGKLVEAVLDKARPLDELIYGVNNILFSKTSEARNWPRAPVKAMAQYRTESAWEVGRIWDLSHTGLQLRTGRGIAQGRTIDIKFFVPKGKIAIEAKAKVLWTQQVDGGGPTPAAHGLQFEEIGTEAQKELVRFVDERVAQILRPT
ncbi:MAG: response regulator [Bdellovibrionota bacterium]